jgi:hypothetical protein
MNNSTVIKGNSVISFASPEVKKEFIRQEFLRSKEAKVNWNEPLSANEEEPILWTPQQEQTFQDLLKAAKQQALIGDSTPTGKADKGSSRIHGVVCRQAITNSRWWQEGVSLWNPSADMKVQLDKSEAVLFHMDSQPNSIKATIGYPITGRADGVGYAKAKEAFKGMIGELLDAKVGETFRKHQVVVKGLGVNLRQSKMNQPLTLLSYSMEDAPFAPGAIQVALKYEMVLSSPWKKIRGYGLKATMVPWDIQRFDIEGCDEDFVVLHSMSGLKGKPLDLVAFSHSVGGCDINTREGVIVPTTGKHAGKAFDITKTDSVVDKWRNAKAKEVVVHFDYSRSEWEFVKSVDIAEGVWGTADYDVIAVNDIDENTVRISAKIEILVAEMPLNVEVSLPEESSGKTQLTPEMLSVLTLQNRVMGEGINKLGAAKRNSLTKLLKMFKGSTPKGTPSCDIQSEQFLQSIQGLIKDGMNDREVISAYEKQFPTGAVFNTGGHTSQYSLYLDFNAIQGIATYIGGSGEGVGHSIAEFLRQLPLNLKMIGSESQIHANFSVIYSSVTAWFKIQLESKNLKKKLVSSLKGTAFGSKIRTIALPELSHKGTAPNCIPKLGVNPNDDILKELAINPLTGEIPARFLDADGKFDSKLMNGEYVTCFRTPMPMQGACEIVITEKVGVGHLALLMHIWAFFNEGDSDGDGVGIIPAFHHLDNANINDPDERKRLMLSMNTHAMGMGGYLVAYGKSNVLNLPCAEFCSFKDAWTKKKIIVEAGSEALKVQVKKGILPYARNKAVTEWIDTVGDVSLHYQNGVSTSYNISVVAINNAIDLQYKLWAIGLDYEIEYAKAHDPAVDVLSKQLTLALRTCAISWRLLYEGLGLAGYSENASKWFKLFNLASSGTHYIEGPFGPKPMTQGTKPEDGLSITKALAEGAEFSHRSDAHVIAGALSRISTVLADARALENPAKNEKRYEDVVASATRFNTAVVRRAQRLCSQGDDAILRDSLDVDPAEMMGGYDEDSSQQAQSCLELFIKSKLWGQLACPWQAANMQRAALFVSESIKLTSAVEDPNPGNN